MISDFKNQPMDQEFKALVAVEEDGRFTREIQTRRVSELPAGDVLIRVHYSSLNFKDALSATGNRGVTRHYPHTPGIDASGVMEESRSDKFRPGDPVVVTGYDLGMDTSGGFGQYIRVPAGWVVPLPAGLTLKEAMIYGTAGFTAGLSVYHLSQVVTPSDGEVLVTGATGGVGSLAVALLARCGYTVEALTGKGDQQNFLTRLGASKILAREDLPADQGKSLLKGLWAGAVDTVGGPVLSNLVKSIKMQGAVTSCGHVAGQGLDMTVFPFIIRGVSLIGINSQSCPMEKRLMIWEHLAGDWKIPQLNTIFTEIRIEDLNEYINRILQGRITGRILINQQ
jgi:putative YhdH/YhfP family quinone oxidoreductase